LSRKKTQLAEKSSSLFAVPLSILTAYMSLGRHNHMPIQPMTRSSAAKCLQNRRKLFTAINYRPSRVESSIQRGGK